MLGKRKAVFIDRDGTINSDEFGYIKKTREFILYPFTKKALEKIKELGFLVFIVTNQSGIARGYYTFRDLEKIHYKLLQEVGEDKIDSIFISPYHQNGYVKPYNISHIDRKPQLGMFYEAMQKYDFNVKESYMIGDKYSDIEFGKKAELITILVLTGNGEEEFLENRENWQFKPDYIAENILVAAEIIENLEKS